MNGSVGVNPSLKTPRMAGIAGVVFSILMAISLWLLRLPPPPKPADIGGWLAAISPRVSLALNFIPFAGIAFLWFVGVLRDRLGAREDRFFATVFLGSGLLFLAMLFVAAAAVGGVIGAYSAQADAAAFGFGRAFAFDATNIYALKMAGVFMISASTLGIKTGFVAQWIAAAGYIAALFILIGSSYFD